MIKGDFARTIKETKAAEAQAQQDFIEFERETKMSITTKETGLDHTDRSQSQISWDIGSEATSQFSCRTSNTGSKVTQLQEPQASRRKTP